MLRVDAPGHGASPASGAPPTLQSYADDLHAQLTELAWTPTAVVGFSFGGMIAQALALAYPGDVSALVISACTSRFADESRRAIAARGTTALREGMDALVAPTMERWFSPAFLGTPLSNAVRRRLASNSVEGWMHAWQAIAGVNTHAGLSAIAVPTLCLAGGADRSAPPDVVRTVADQIPGATFRVLEGAPHMFFIEQPHETAAAITAFLSSTPSSM